MMVPVWCVHVLGGGCIVNWGWWLRSQVRKKNVLKDFVHVAASGAACLNALDFQRI
jgi:hypothetical protein